MKECILEYYLGCMLQSYTSTLGTCAKKKKASFSVKEQFRVWKARMASTICQVAEIMLFVWIPLHELRLIQGSHREIYLPMEGTESRGLSTDQGSQRAQYF